MELTNMEMMNHLIFLRNISGKVTGKLAYAVSRNMRKIADESLEFEKIKNELIEKYGEKNEDGVYSIGVTSSGYSDFINEIKEYSAICHEVNIFKLEPDCLFESNLNADEMLQLDFMLEE